MASIVSSGESPGADVIADGEAGKCDCAREVIVGAASKVTGRSMSIHSSSRAVCLYSRSLFTPL